MAWDVKTIVRSPSKTFAVGAACFSIGILFGPFIVFIEGHILAGMALILAALAWMLKERESRVILLLLFAFTLGLFRYGQAFPPSDMLLATDFAGQSIRVSGIITGEVEGRIDHQRAIIQHVFLSDEPVHGRVLVRFSRYPALETGALLTFACTLEAPEPIESFRYDLHLEAQGILAICSRPEFLDIGKQEKKTLQGFALGIKDRLVGRLRLLLPEPQASFVAGLLFGGSSSLSSELRDDFSRTGTSHILAASGFNVSLFTVVLLAWLLGTPLGRKRAVLVAAGILGLYIIMAGATPAVMRAGIMAAMLLVAKWIQRKAYLPNMVLGTLALMLLLNPLLLLQDVGFQLSFIATIAILALAPKFKTVFLWIPERFGIQEAVVTSLAASLATLPIVIWHFRSISIISPLVNFLILPLIPFVMAASMLAILVSFLSSTIASIVMLPAWAGSTLILQIITWYSALPFAEFGL